MDQKVQQFLTEKFSSFLSEERRSFIEKVLQNRTDYIQVVLEDLIDPHNVNAILRTGECLGIQHYHIIENQYPFKIGRGVSKGATKWIDIHQYEGRGASNTTHAIEQLKEKGFKVLVTSPKFEALPIESIDLQQPIALVFGNEKEGVSQKSIDLADGLVKIPVYGFTESYNVSVAGAILMQHLIERMRKDVGNWQFSPEVYENYQFNWLKKCMARPDYYQNYFVKVYELMKNHD
jgi:tRNA (guanosine-2'-O-)-methyltransferase